MVYGATIIDDRNFALTIVYRTDKTVCKKTPNSLAHVDVTFIFITGEF